MTTNNCTVYFFYRWQGTYIVEICKQKHEKKEFTFKFEFKNHYSTNI